MRHCRLRPAIFLVIAGHRHARPDRASPSSLPTRPFVIADLIGNLSSSLACPFVIADLIGNLPPIMPESSSRPAPTGHLLRHCRPRPCVIADLIGNLLDYAWGSGVGPSGHEGVGAPNAVPPLAPTMSLTSSRTPHPSQLDGRPYRSHLTPVVAIRACARTGRPGYSLLPTPSIVPPTPLVSLR